MSPPGDPASAPDGTGPPDRQTLSLLQRQFASDDLVTDSAFEPGPLEPRWLRISIDERLYRPEIEAVKLDVRWFKSGDFSFHYVETGDENSRWECRWDRHPNRHDPRLHFHRPPDWSSVEELSLSTHPLEVYSTVMAAIERRIEQQGDGE